MFGNQQQGQGLNQQDYQDFVNRYQQGAPHEGYSDQEVAQRYQQVSSQLTPQQYQQAAQQAFSNMPPDQRQQFGQTLAQQAQQQGYAMPQMQPQQYQDPNALAQMTTQVHQQQPNLIGQMLGQNPAQSTQTWETLDPQTRDLFVRQWGARAQAEWEQENARNSSPLHSTAAKAAMAGIAALAVHNLIQYR